VTVLVDLSILPQHSRLSRRITSLYYHGDRFGSDVDYESWNRDRAASTYPQDWIEREQHEASINFEALDEDYSSLELLRSNSILIQRTMYDTGYLETLLQACRKVRESTFLFEDCSSTLKELKRRFVSTMARPSGDWEWQLQGVHQLHSLAHAVQRTDIQLDSLTLWYVSYRIAADSRPKGPRGLLSFFGSLTRLKMSFELSAAHTQPDGMDYLSDSLSYFHSSKTFQRDVLNAATNVRILKLQMPTHEFQHLGVVRPFLGLEHVIGSLTFPHLLELALSNFIASEDCMVKLLIRHANTLRRLSLTDFAMGSGDWQQTFIRIAGKMRNLYEIKLRGTFQFSIMHADGFSFDFTDYKVGKIWPIRDAIELYIVTGRRCWPDFQGMDVTSEDTWTDVQGDYLPPGLHEVISDDDPIRVYDRNWIDDCVEGRQVTRTMSSVVQQAP
jgi:hypothetical protein